MINKRSSKSTSLIEVVAQSTLAIFKAFIFGTRIQVRNWKKSKSEKSLTLTAWILLLLSISYSSRWNFPFFLNFKGSSLSQWITTHITREGQFGTSLATSVLIFCIFTGFVEIARRNRFQKAIDHLGLETATGTKPQIIDVKKLKDFKTGIVVKAVGIDVAAFKSQTGALESSFNSIIQEIRICRSNRQLIEIILAEKELPNLVSFDDAIANVNCAYSFAVGLSHNGFVIADLCEIHHMLIAGSTGSGKSGFFKQAVIGLLKSSEFLQLYLIDLKRVDAKPFEKLSNIRVIKDNVPALACLETVVKEMDRRYKFLESSGRTEIDPVRDKLDRIVVGVDEASLLFTVEKNSKATKILAENARELTDKIAKLGRAAGIHLILATQKVVKETIDTRVQANINSKMCFRVNTQLSSITVLGHKAASELPKIPGRGIWSVGVNEDIIQVPRLSNEEAIEQIEELVSKFNVTSPLKQPMIFGQVSLSKNASVFKALKKNKDQDLDDGLKDAFDTEKNGFKH